jgi:hypothetical protein
LLSRPGALGGQPRARWTAPNLSHALGRRVWLGVGTGKKSNVSEDELERREASVLPARKAMSLLGEEPAESASESSGDEVDDSSSDAAGDPERSS